ncbi:MAG: hypothetical protein JRD92_10315 [Deltaproteobacteria bacterium]|nr:hypothetical protein [Deltaproteobacteria bacterium]
MRSYLGLSLGLSLCLMFAVGCGDDSTNGTGGAGGSAGTGGAAGEGGAGGTPAGGETIMKEISLGCANSSPLGAQSILSAVLKVTAGPIGASQEFDATLSGTATFPEAFLDAAQDLVPGGLKQAVVPDLKYIVQVRSGATGGGDGVGLGADGANITPGLTQFCQYPTTTICTQDSDCVVPPCNDPVVLVDVPTSDDCAPGGVCDGLGKAIDPTSQCELNGFCVTGDLDLPLLEVTQAYTAEATGDVLFGWADQGLTNNTFDDMTNLYTIPKPNTADPIQQGLQVNAGLVVAIECVMGVDEGEDPEDAENDLVGLTPDEDLISFPIAP